MIDVSSGNSRKNYYSLGLATFFTLALFIGMISSCSDRAKARPNFIFKEAPRAGLMAKIGDREITEETLIGPDKLDFFELKKREYDLRMDRLNRLLVEDLVGAEAKKANLSLEEFVDKKVTSGPVKISDSEFKKFVAEKHIPENQLNPQITERIMAYLQGSRKQDMLSNFVAKLTKNKPVEVYFAKPKMQVEIDVGDAPTFGKKDAPVTIVEFSDAQCPYCASAAKTVSQLKKKFGNKIRFAFKHFPLPMHHDAKPASEASMCVNEQSSDKFWKFHDLMFDHQDKLDAASLEKYAKEAGADLAKYNECVKSNRFSDFVKKDVEAGEKVGVKSTPTFFVNGQILNGSLPFDAFSEAIEDELNEKKK